MSKAKKRKTSFERKAEVIRMLAALTSEEIDAMVAVAEAYTARSAATTEDEREAAQRRVAEAEAVVNGLIALLIMGRDAQVTAWAQLRVPMLLGFVLTLGEIGLIAGLRMWLTVRLGLPF